MDALGLHSIFDYLSGQALWWGLILLSLSAMIEYIFPPFPGDTVTLVGAVLIPAAGWPWPLVFGAVIIGSLVGAAIDWRVGVWLQAHRDADTWINRILGKESIQRRVDKLLERFERHGAAYIVLNRFIPAFRAIFFLAAGMAGLRLWKVLLHAAISAALWNTAILSVGYFVGYNIDALAGWIDRYTQLFWVLLGAGVLGWLLLQLWRRYRRKSSSDA